MKQFPAFIDLTDRSVLVVGGGAMAARRTAMAQRSNARVSVVAPELCEAFSVLAEVSHISEAFSDEHLDGKRLVFVASDDKGLEERVSVAAEARDILVNVADRMELSTFIMPSIVDRSPLIVAISSGGQAPILARMLREKLESLVPAALGRLADFASGYRKQVKAAIPDIAGRRRFWENVARGAVGERVLSGEMDGAKRMISDLITAEEKGQRDVGQGEVYLVGSGPGDPDLLTFRAIRLMQQCDVVLHDRLVTDEILDLVRRDADRIFVGKAQGDHAMPQEEISRTLAKLAKDGKRVLRLKGGDPFTFGRGGEEIELLASEGVSFQVVPGVTAASGCAAYAGIPLTHRDHAQACVFVTGHTKDDKLDLNWTMLSQPNQTVVVYMGLNSVAEFMKSMLEHGVPTDTPAAAIDNGTRVNQRVVTGTVGSLAQDIIDAELPGPALIMVGHVVKLAGKLQWYGAGE
jgi:uroporphyrin-III C-methyltransferase / precorrin-2 dehydrogenase / sirohydrochlorin ferrochelatase